LNNRLQSLLKLLEKNPADDFLLYGVALEYLSLKDYLNSEEYFLKLIRTNPSYVPAYMQYAQLKAAQNKIEEAKNLYSQGIKIAKENGDKHAAKEMEEFLNELE
jgi:tetratricopeptide (TPR) repeat protein